MTFAEFLKSQGASDEDLKLLDTPVMRKAHERMEAQLAEAAAAKQKADELVARNREWATQVEEQNQSYLRERDSAKVEAAAAAAKIAKMQELGLIEIAEKMEPGSTKKEEPASALPDLSKYVDRDTLLSVAEREGEAIAVVGDIAYEHALLFPGKAPNFRELRNEAKQRKLTVEQVWQEKYNVPAAREARAKAEKEAETARLHKEWEADFVAKHPQSNPLLQPPTVSKTPFTNVIPSTNGGEKQPWLKTDAEKEQGRMNKVLEKMTQQGLVH